VRAQGHADGFWTVANNTLYVSSGDDSEIRALDLAAAHPTPVPVGATGTPLGVLGDRLLVELGITDTVQARSLTTGATTPPVSIGKHTLRADVGVHAGALWYTHRIDNGSERDTYELMMYVP